MTWIEFARRQYALRTRRKPTKAETAAKMRAYNLTHGSGCRSIARAIEQRLNREARANG